MRHFAIDWSNFLQYASIWKDISRQIRQLFLEIKAGQRRDASEFGPDLDMLIERGFLSRFQNLRNVRLHENARPFNGAIRAMSRHSVFEKSNNSILISYLKENFTHAEIVQLTGAYHARYQTHHTAVSKVQSELWIDGFLSDRKDWTRSHSGPDDNRLFGGDEIVEAAHKLVATATAWSEPAPLHELPARLPELSPQLLGDAIHFSINHLLLFPGLTTELLPVIGLLPNVRDRLQRPQAVRPNEVSPHTEFQLAILLEDMTTLLVAACAQDLRVRMKDGDLHAKIQSQITADLAQLPAFVEHWFSAAEDRITNALRILRELRLIAYRGSNRANRRLAATDGARKWLGQSESERLKGLIDYLELRTKISPQIGYAYYFAKETVARGLLTAFSDLTVHHFVGVDAFLSWQCQSANPFIEAAQRRPDYFDGWGGHLTTEHLEKQWRNSLLTFLRDHLLPIGGVALGLYGDDKLCFAMTDIGRYALGFTAEFQYATVAQQQCLVVQPNFDVVFLQPSPLAEAIIGRFAERQSNRGKGVGALFKLTKASVLTAAASEFPMAQLLDDLRTFSVKDLPANVEREIAGWYSSCRPIAVRTSILIDCPDAQTAAQIAASSGRKATLLTDTVLELRDQKWKRELLQKLKKQGIFVAKEVGEQVAASDS